MGLRGRLRAVPEQSRAQVGFIGQDDTREATEHGSENR